MSASTYIKDMIGLWCEGHVKYRKEIMRELG